MIEAANNILEFTDGIDYERFVRDKILQFAVVKNFEIVGEAAYHLSKELRDKTKNQIEWQKVIAFRHILVHD
ncbi:MAG: DUF86 domain-containing protein [Bacteroidia bacterium]|nr:DUF86 domain-containing protein [Bacteroidia bacterium]